MGRILGEFTDASLRSVTLQRRGRGLKLTVNADVLPNTDLIRLRERLSDRIFAEARGKIGLGDRLQLVDVSIRIYSAKEGRIATGIMEEARSWVSESTTTRFH